MKAIKFTLDMNETIKSHLLDYSCVSISSNGPGLILIFVFPPSSFALIN